MMQKIFKDKKEPLYGRNTGELRVKPFRPSVLKQIMADAKPGYSHDYNPLNGFNSLNS